MYGECITFVGVLKIFIERIYYCSVWNVLRELLSIQWNVQRDELIIDWNVVYI